MSSRDMTLTDLKHTSKAFDDTHTVRVSGFKDKTKISKLDLILQRLDKIDKRLDHLEQFEKFVLDQFKKHEWTK